MKLIVFILAIITFSHGVLQSSKLIPGKYEFTLNSEFFATPVIQTGLYKNSTAFITIRTNGSKTCTEGSSVSLCWTIQGLQCMIDMGDSEQSSILMHDPWMSYPEDVEGVYASNCDERTNSTGPIVVRCGEKIARTQVEKWHKTQGSNYSEADKRKNKNRHVIS